MDGAANPSPNLQQSSTLCIQVSVHQSVTIMLELQVLRSEEKTIQQSLTLHTVW